MFNQNTTLQEMKGKMIHKATKTDSFSIAKLAVLMWENHTVDELAKEFEEIISNDESAIFLLSCDNQDIGFASCQLRHNYVEGTSGSPVGYLEGIFVKQEYRNQGLAKALLKQCETWAKEKGCSEFASDCELENDVSLKFHLKMGFAEANRIICFTKSL